MKLSWPIRTGQKRIPWTWAFLIGLPWITFEYVQKVSEAPLTFTLRKFIEDPGWISFIISINILFNFMVGVTVSYVSDKLWTRWGRRKVFFIVSCLFAGAMTVMIPIVGHLWLLVVVIICFQFFVDFNKPWEPLFNEVIPSPQRGRAGMLRMLSVNLAALFLTGVLIAQFDAQYEFVAPWGPVSITGEMVLYWSVSITLWLTAAFLAWGVKEEAPLNVVSEDGTLEGYRKSRFAPVQWKVSGTRKSVLAAVRQMFEDIFSSRQKLWVYLLYICPLAGTLAVTHPSYITLQTDQLGLSKEQFGMIQVVGMIVMIAVFTPAAGLLADRLDRLSMMKIGIGGVSCVQLCFYFYLNFWSEGKASYELVIAVDICSKLFLSWVWAVWSPLVYDYIPRAEMGTFQAGIMFTSGVASFVLINVGGQWVNLWTVFFGTGYSPTNYDQSSVLVLALLLGALSVTACSLFGRGVATGRIQPLGKKTA
ncbi:MFS transporter [Pelagicoccus mobilis]|uniref:MFS transporter n=1 Tax=Pelagicoccus mobilis TaxID=415221 RepID=A0A934S3I0_9BACT|nr:MFS transporter [Pelagicoccus mobilis]MBK1878739.1 MFS transporter [Pelagicoccus mobilis]